MRICIGVITRNRKIMLADLLHSFLALRVPDGCKLVYAIVENDTQKSLDEVVAILGSANETHYEIEPTPGIPAARNKVLEISLRENCDFTAFVDDDETVDATWLEQIFKELTSRKLDLAGGPVRLQPVAADASFQNRIIWAGLVERNRRIERKAARRREQGSDGKVSIITSNWLIDNEFLRTTGITFDESIGLSGGSDTAFYKKARSLAVESGWAPEAIVYEEMPLSRLTTLYQFKRGRDQSIASFHNKYDGPSLKAAVRTFVFCVFKVLGGFLLIIAIPFTKGKTLTLAARNFGVALGRIYALFGVRSSHYRDVHGT